MMLLENLLKKSYMSSFESKKRLKHLKLMPAPMRIWNRVTGA